MAKKILGDAALKAILKQAKDWADGVKVVAGTGIGVAADGRTVSAKVASTSQLGAVKIGSGINVDSAGTISVTAFDPSATLKEAKDYADSKVSTELEKLVGGAPAALDTLKEIADYLDNDDDTKAGLVQQIAKVDAKVANVYTKSESDGKYETKVNVEGIRQTLQSNINEVASGVADQILELGDAVALKANSADVYTKTAADGKFAAKATTLSGYGITDAYTKTQADAKYEEILGEYTAADIATIVAAL